MPENKKVANTDTTSADIMKEVARAHNGRLPGYGDASGDANDDLDEEWISQLSEDFEKDPLELDALSLAKRKEAEKKREQVSHQIKKGEPNK